MRIGKWLGVAGAGLAGAIVVTLLAVWLFINPNDYKPKLAAAVKQATGRELQLPGDIRLSVFPWIALQLGPASLGNPAGFSAQPFVSFQHAAVRVKLLPLLFKRLEVGRVEVDGLDLRLLKNAAGQGNWEGFGHAEAGAPAAASSGGETGQTLMGIEGVKVSGARVSYEEITLQNLAIETGPYFDGGMVPVTLHVSADRGVAGEHASLDAHFDISVDRAAQRLRLAALNTNSVVTLHGDPRPVRWSVSAPAIDVDWKAQTVVAAAFVLNLAGAEVNGSLQGRTLAAAPALAGTLTLAPLVLREYLPRLGMVDPRTRDPKAFSMLSASSTFTYYDKAVHFSKLQATLDDTHMTGSAAVVNLATQSIEFDLAVDHIDVDRYLAPEAGPGVAPAPVAVAVRAAPAAAAGEATKPLEVNGTLAVGSVHVAPLDLANVTLTVATHDQVMHVFPIKAQVDGGQYSGDITWDSRGATPAVSMDEHLSGIDVGRLVAQSKGMHVAGKGNVSLKATSRGTGADALMKGLNGHFEAYVSGGAVEGIDLGFELARAEALIRHQDLPNVQDTKRTKFDAMKLSAEINNGVAATHDLIISSPVLRVTGQGSANIPTKALNFALLADTLRTAGTTPIQVPVTVTGTFANPAVRPDVEALAKGQLKQKLKDVLQDKLKGLFGKP